MWLICGNTSVPHIRDFIAFVICALIRMWSEWYCKMSAHFTGLVCDFVIWELNYIYTTYTILYYTTGGPTDTSSVSSSHSSTSSVSIQSSSSSSSSTPSSSSTFPGQMFLMDRFFDGAFLTFGLEVIAFAEQDQEDRLDPLIYVFPRMTKVRGGT